LNLFPAIVNFNSWSSVALGNNGKRPLKIISEKHNTLSRCMTLPVFHVFLYLLVFKLSANQTLEGENGVGRIDNSLTLCRQADQPFSVLGKGNDRRCCPRTLSVLDYSGCLALHDRDTRIRCPQVNANDGAFRVEHHSEKWLDERRAYSPLTLVFMLLALAGRGMPYRTCSEQSKG
jgi:hypothetical protein